MADQIHSPPITISTTNTASSQPPSSVSLSANTATSLITHNHDQTLQPTPATKRPLPTLSSEDTPKSVPHHITSVGKTGVDGDLIDSEDGMNTFNDNHRGINFKRRYNHSDKNNSNHIMIHLKNNTNTNEKDGNNNTGNNDNNTIPIITTPAITMATSTIPQILPFLEIPDRSNNSINNLASIDYSDTAPSSAASLTTLRGLTSAPSSTTTTNNNSAVSHNHENLASPPTSTHSDNNNNPNNVSPPITVSQIVPSPADIPKISSILTPATIPRPALVSSQQAKGKLQQHIRPSSSSVSSPLTASLSSTLLLSPHSHHPEYVPKPLLTYSSAEIRSRIVNLREINPITTQLVDACCPQRSQKGHANFCLVCLTPIFTPDRHSTHHHLYYEQLHAQQKQQEELAAGRVTGPPILGGVDGNDKNIWRCALCAVEISITGTTQHLNSFGHVLLTERQNHQGKNPLQKQLLNTLAIRLEALLERQNAGTFAPGCDYNVDDDAYAQGLLQTYLQVQLHSEPTLPKQMSALYNQQQASSTPSSSSLLSPNQPQSGVLGGMSLEDGSIDPLPFPTQTPNITITLSSVTDRIIPMRLFDEEAQHLIELLCPNRSTTSRHFCTTCWTPIQQPPSHFAPHVDYYNNDPETADIRNVFRCDTCKIELNSLGGSKSSHESSFGHKLLSARALKLAQAECKGSSNNNNNSNSSDTHNHSNTDNPTHNNTNGKPTAMKDAESKSNNDGPSLTTLFGTLLSTTSSNKAQNNSDDTESSVRPPADSLTNANNNSSTPTTTIHPLPNWSPPQQSQIVQSGQRGNNNQEDDDDGVFTNVSAEVLLKAKEVLQQKIFEIRSKALLISSGSLTPMVPSKRTSRITNIKPTARDTTMIGSTSHRGGSSNFHSHHHNNQYNTTMHDGNSQHRDPLEDDPFHLDSHLGNSTDGGRRSDRVRTHQLQQQQQQQASNKHGPGRKRRGSSNVVTSENDQFLDDEINSTDLYNQNLHNSNNNDQYYQHLDQHYPINQSTMMYNNNDDIMNDRSRGYSARNTGRRGHPQFLLETNQRPDVLTGIQIINPSPVILLPDLPGGIISGPDHQNRTMVQNNNNIMGPSSSLTHLLPPPQATYCYNDPLVVKPSSSLLFPSSGQNITTRPTTTPSTTTFITTAGEMINMEHTQLFPTKPTTLLSKSTPPMFPPHVFNPSPPLQSSSSFFSSSSSSSSFNPSSITTTPSFYALQQPSPHSLLLRSTPVIQPLRLLHSIQNPQSSLSSTQQQSSFGGQMLKPIQLTPLQAQAHTITQNLLRQQQHHLQQQQQLNRAFEQQAQQHLHLQRQPRQSPPQLPHPQLQQVHYPQQQQHQQPHHQRE